MADIFYTDASTIDETLYPWQSAAEPARRRRGLRTWSKFVLTYTLLCAGLALLLRDVVLRTGGNEAGGLAVVAGVAMVALLSALLVLYTAGRMNRL